MKICFALMLIASVVGAIPPTMIDAGTFSSYSGSIDVTSPWTDPSPQAVTYNTAFSQLPTFALLLSGFNFNAVSPNTVGYDIDYGTITTSGAQFNISNSGDARYILELNFRWVATVGEHLQLFPISYTFTQSTRHFAVPFDYNNKVVWSPGNFEVQITSIVSSFHVNPSANTYGPMTCIARWSTQQEMYTTDYEGTQVLNVNAIYGTKRPFTNNDGVDSVMFYAIFGNLGNRISLFLLFHKVQQPNTDPYVTTGFGRILTDYLGYKKGATFTYDINNPDYNVNGVDPAAIRVYGFEQIMFVS